MVVGEAEGVHLILRGLVLDAGLRDRVRAVVSVGGVLGGRTDEDGPWGEASIRDWMAAWFRHRELDTEAQRSTPYLALQWLDRSADPPGVPGLPLGSARFPEPADEGGLDAYVDPLDLGPVPTDVPLEQAARALWAVTECVVASRRG